MLDWKELTRLTAEQTFCVERVRMANTGVAIEGPFELPPIARLPADDLAFVAAFIHCHGSIKQMEKWFGISYPTVKGRLNRIAERLDFVEVDMSGSSAAPDDVLDRLDRGEINVDDALKELET